MINERGLVVGNMYYLIAGKDFPRALTLKVYSPSAADFEILMDVAGIPFERGVKP